ncbi:MAG TPA: beta-propeller fold lactonase family protein, partial [Polyangiaceae bacterium]
FTADGRLLGYVANRFSDDVSVVDLDAMQELGRPSLGRDPVDTDGPRSITLDPERGLAYVVLSYPLESDGPHVETRGDGRAGYVMVHSLSDLTPLGELRLERSPTDLSLSQDGTRLAVSHFDQVRARQVSDDIADRRAALALIEPAFGLADGTAAARFVRACVAPAGIVYDKDGARAYVACTGEDSLVVVDVVAAEVLARVPAGALVANKPFGLSPDPGGRRLLLSNQVASSVVLFAIDDDPAPLATTFVTGVPFGMEWLDETRFVVALQGPDATALVDSTSGAVVVQRAYSQDECRNPSAPRRVGESRLFLVCEGDHYTPGRLVELDPGSLAIRAGVELGIYPDRLAVLEP